MEVKGNYEVFEKIINDPDATLSDLKCFVEIAEDLSRLTQLINHPKAKFYLEDIYNKNIKVLYVDLAYHKETPDHILENISKGGSLYQIPLLANPKTTTKALENICERFYYDNYLPKDFERKAFAIFNHPNFKPYLMDVLLDKKIGINMDTLIVNSIQTAPETLVRLAEKKNPIIRRLVAAHPNTSTEFLLKLTQARDIETATAARYNLKRQEAANPNTPTENLLILSKSRDKKTSLAAMENLKNRSVPLLMDVLFGNDSQN